MSAVGPLWAGAGRQLSQEVQDHVRDAVQRTAAHTDGFDRLTVRPRLENELASRGLYVHDEWVDAVADLIGRGRHETCRPAVRHARSSQPPAARSTGRRYRLRRVVADLAETRGR